MTVSLVGAGPGDPDLLTMKAARLLAEAEIVVHDALVGDGVLALIPPHVERIDVGKRVGKPVPQEMISALLVELGRAGQPGRPPQGWRPVRLRSRRRGGPRAPEAGVAYEIVPGITSSIAAPAAAGVPVTHRGVAAGFTVVTGHRRPGEPDVDWRSLAKVGTTIVILMGVTHRGVIAGELIAGGLAPTPPSPPSGSPRPTRDRRPMRPLRPRRRPIESPATIVIGAVASLDLAPLRSYDS